MNNVKRTMRRRTLEADHLRLTTCPQSRKRSGQPHAGRAPACSLRQYSPGYDLALPLGGVPSARGRSRHDHQDACPALRGGAPQSGNALVFDAGNSGHSDRDHRSGLSRLAAGGDRSGPRRFETSLCYRREITSLLALSRRGRPKAKRGRVKLVQQRCARRERRSIRHGTVEGCLEHFVSAAVGAAADGP